MQRKTEKVNVTREERRRTAKQIGGGGGGGTYKGERINLWLTEIVFPHSILLDVRSLFVRIICSGYYNCIDFIQRVDSCLAPFMEKVATK